jgi:hypothetical protein
MSTAVTNEPSTRTAVWARRGVVAIVALATIESIAAAMAARDPGEAAWPELSAAVEDRDDWDPVIVAQDWLGPVARMHVPSAAALAAVARPDLHGIPRFHVIGWGDEGEAAITRDREGLPMPQLEQQRSFGPLVWTTWTSPAAGTLVEDLTAESSVMRVASDAGNCRGRGSFRCDEGTIEPRIAEIDYRPRRCLALAVADGATLTMTWPSARLGDTLRGHIGMADYNARLRDDGPVLLVVRVGGDEVLRKTITDAQGWTAFAIPTTPEVIGVEVVITTALSGTFGAEGYDPTPSRLTCFELRTLAGGE